jgi:UDPglucose 6-dehydrogenase
LKATEKTNEEQSDRVVELAEKLAGPLDQKRIAILGLAFKKDTDDIREASSIRVIDRLSQKGARLVGYDPMAMPNFERIFGDTIELAKDPLGALRGADCAIVMTEWDELRKLKAKDYIAQMRQPILVDARRIYNAPEFKELKFAAIGLGSAA